MHFLYFWGHSSSRHDVITKACLSQFYSAPFIIDNVLYPTAEHWMMASKARLFGDEVALAQILATSDPRNAKSLGRTVTRFSERTWNQQARSIVTQGNFAKFSQNAELRDYLLGTGQSILVEASPQDQIWGIGVAEFPS